MTSLQDALTRCFCPETADGPSGSVLYKTTIKPDSSCLIDVWTLFSGFTRNNSHTSVSYFGAATPASIRGLTTHQRHANQTHPKVLMTSAAILANVNAKNVEAVIFLVLKCHVMSKQM